MTVRDENAARSLMTYGFANRVVFDKDDSGNIIRATAYEDKTGIKLETVGYGTNSYSSSIYGTYKGEVKREQYNVRDYAGNLIGGRQYDPGRIVAGNVTGKVGQGISRSERSQLNIMRGQLKGIKQGTFGYVNLQENIKKIEAKEHGQRYTPQYLDTSTGKVTDLQIKQPKKGERLKYGTTTLGRSFTKKASELPQQFRVRVKKEQAKDVRLQIQDDIASGRVAKDVTIDGKTKSKVMDKYNQKKYEQLYSTTSQEIYENLPKAKEAANLSKKNSNQVGYYTTGKNPIVLGVEEIKSDKKFSKAREVQRFGIDAKSNPEAWAIMYVQKKIPKQNFGGAFADLFNGDGVSPATKKYLKTELGKNPISASLRLGRNIAKDPGQAYNKFKSGVVTKASNVKTFLSDPQNLIDSLKVATSFVTDFGKGGIRFFKYNKDIEKILLLKASTQYHSFVFSQKLKSAKLTQQEIKKYRTLFKYSIDEIETIMKRNPDSIKKVYSEKEMRTFITGMVMITSILVFKKYIPPKVAITIDRIFSGVAAYNFVKKPSKESLGEFIFIIAAMKSDKITNYGLKFINKVVTGIPRFKLVKIGEIFKSGKSSRKGILKFLDGWKLKRIPKSVKRAAGQESLLEYGAGTTRAKSSKVKVGIKKTSEQNIVTAQSKLNKIEISKVAGKIKIKINEGDVSFNFKNSLSNISELVKLGRRKLISKFGKQLTSDIFNLFNNLKKLKGVNSKQISNLQKQFIFKSKNLRKAKQYFLKLERERKLLNAKYKARKISQVKYEKKLATLKNKWDKLNRPFFFFFKKYTQIDLGIGEGSIVIERIKLSKIIKKYDLIISKTQLKKSFLKIPGISKQINTSGLKTFISKKFKVPISKINLISYNAQASFIKISRYLKNTKNILQLRKKYGIKKTREIIQNKQKLNKLINKLTSEKYINFMKNKMKNFKLGEFFTKVKYFDLKGSEVPVFIKSAEYEELFKLYSYIDDLNVPQMKVSFLDKLKLRVSSVGSKIKTSVSSNMRRQSLFSKNKKAQGRLLLERSKQSVGSKKLEVKYKYSDIESELKTNPEELRIFKAKFNKIPKVISLKGYSIISLSNLNKTFTKINPTIKNNIISVSGLKLNQDLRSKLNSKLKSKQIQGIKELSKTLQDISQKQGTIQKQGIVQKQGTIGKTILDSIFTSGLIVGTVLTPRYIPANPIGRFGDPNGKYRLFGFNKISLSINKMNSYSADLYSRVYGVVAGKQEKQKLLSRGRFFTGQEVRKLVR